MSFTAEVRDELSRCEPTCEYCDLATLTALVRVCGTLSITGPGRYRLTVATETGAVARTTSPAEFAQMMKTESDQLRDIVTQFNIKAE